MSGNFHKIGNLRGADGVGVPEGGQPGDALLKVGNSDFATSWGHIHYSDIDGKVPKSALPDIGNDTRVVDSEAAMLNLPAVAGNMVIRTDLGKTFVLSEEPASELDNWVELVTSSDVQSVNGKTGNVTLTKSDVGLSNVNNTADSDKPTATASVNGLMPKADKSKLDKATANASANTLMSRDGSGKSKVKGLTIESAPSSNTDATTKEYVDATVSTVAGGSRLTTDNLDALRSTAMTGVVEGFVKGCPVGGKVVDNMSAGFVKDPVWKFEVRPEGLDYATQRIQLLNSVPKFMIGFVWERIYNPVTGKWTGWTCVGGDSGYLLGLKGGTLATTSVEAPFRSVDDSATSLYNNKEPLTVHRTANEVRFFGAMTSSKVDDMASTSTSVNPVLAYFADSGRSPNGAPGADYTLNIQAPSRIQFPIQSGSYRNHWMLGPTEAGGAKLAFVAGRYGPNIASNPPWLPFNVTWPAPPVNTYTGPGFVPPEIPSQSTTSPT